MPGILTSKKKYYKFIIIFYSLVFSILISFFIVFFNQKKTYTFEISNDPLNLYQDLERKYRDIKSNLIKFFNVIDHIESQTVFGDPKKNTEDYKLKIKDFSFLPEIRYNFPQYFLNINNKIIYVHPIIKSYLDYDNLYFNIVTTQNFSDEDMKIYLDLYNEKLISYYTNQFSNLKKIIKNKLVLSKPSNLDLKFQFYIERYYKQIERKNSLQHILIESKNLNEFCTRTQQKKSQNTLYNVSPNTLCLNDPITLQEFHNLIETLNFCLITSCIDGREEYHYVAKDVLYKILQNNISLINMNYDKDVQILLSDLDYTIKSFKNYSISKAKLISTTKDINYFIIDFAKYTILFFFISSFLYIMFNHYKLKLKRKY